MIIFIVLFLMSFFASIASLFLKKTVAHGLRIKNIIFNPYFYLGGILYVCSALLNMYLLKRLPYSIVVPLGSLTYILTLVIAHTYLGEPITKNKIISILSIFLGVIFLAVF